MAFDFEYEVSSEIQYIYKVVENMDMYEKYLILKYNNK